VRGTKMGIRGYDPAPGFAFRDALAPPHSELRAHGQGANFSWVDWFPIRMGSCRTFAEANPCGIESDMWTLARALIIPSQRVLELGARYGTTSCVLAEVTHNHGGVVSVEPDQKAHAALRANLDSHRCNVAVFRGTVGQTPQVVLEFPNRSLRYEVQTRQATAADHPLPHLTYERLEQLSGRQDGTYQRFQFNVLVLDCEGCINDMLSSRILASHSLELILLEMDSPRKVDYSMWHLRFERHGFRRVWKLEDSIYSGAAPMHAAYLRGTRRVPSCEEYAKRQSGWPRCRHKIKHIRPGLDAPFTTCGSRLTCLSAEVVNGSREQAQIRYILAKKPLRDRVYLF
jgi:FkbM family methyltransferase